MDSEAKLSGRLEEGKQGPPFFLLHDKHLRGVARPLSGQRCLQPDDVRLMTQLDPWNTCTGREK